MSGVGSRDACAAKCRGWIRCGGAGAGGRRGGGESDFPLLRRTHSRTGGTACRGGRQWRPDQAHKPADRDHDHGLPHEFADAHRLSRIAPREREREGRPRSREERAGLVGGFELRCDDSADDGDADPRAAADRGLVQGCRFRLGLRGARRRMHRREGGGFRSGELRFGHGDLHRPAGQLRRAGVRRQQRLLAEIRHGDWRGGSRVRAQLRALARELLEHHQRVRHRRLLARRVWRFVRHDGWCGGGRFAVQCVP